jgi:hypothetical protein
MSMYHDEGSTHMLTENKVFNMKHAVFSSFKFEI